MWSDLRADAALRELAAIRAADVDVVEAHAHSLEVVARVVPFDAACVGAVDPDTMLLTSGVTIGFEPTTAESERFVELEYRGADFTSFSSLVDRRITLMADGGDLTPARRRDTRFNELTKLMGFAHDVRLTFAVDGSCWAVGDLYREQAGRTFDTRELQFLENAAGLIAAATRAAVHRPDAVVGTSPDGAAVLIVQADGTISGMTAAAQDWFDDQRESGQESRLWWAVNAAVATARSGAPGAYTRVRLQGNWTAVRASSLQPGGPGAPVAVTIDVAGPRDLLDLLLAAHGLTRREREICVEVMAGRSTKEIADRLYIAPTTVQDHLKSIFTKTGVRSRRELVASLTG